MSIISTLATDDIIRRAAIKRLGCIDAAVTRQRVRERPDALDAGEWFVLNVKRNHDANWEVIARRRSKGELLDFIESRSTR